MDIVTHGAMGVILAAPFMEKSPEVAVGLMLGNVLPDLDALSRIFGKRAFLACHQTFTHSLPIIFIMGVVLMLWLPVDLCLALMAGMFLHVGLDLTNTYGVMCLFPFRRRFALEWIFFVDSIVVILTMIFGLLIYFDIGVKAYNVVLYVTILINYWLFKWWLRRLAIKKYGGKVISFIPSALYPWKFLGCSDDGNGIKAFSYNLLSGETNNEEAVTVLDEKCPQTVICHSDFMTMKKLSPAYHVTSVVQEKGLSKYTCRDLRVRNFKGKFGTLELWLDENEKVVKEVFYV